MAENKKSFVLYADMIHTVRKLPKEKQAELFMTILEYVNDENPEVDDLLVGIAFEPIKHQLKRDLREWDEIRKKRSEAGRRGGINSGLSRNNEANEANASSASSNEANEAVTVTATVTVNDTVNVNVNKYFFLKGEAIKNYTPFEYCQKNFQQIIESYLMSFGNGVVTVEILKAEFDKYFPSGSTFTDVKHLQNAVRKKIELLAEEKKPVKKFSTGFAAFGKEKN